AIFGNFINRVMVLSHKYFDGKVMEAGALTEGDRKVLEELSSYPAKIEKSIGAYRFREALSYFINVARLGNKYLADEEPWKVIKNDEERVKTVLNVSLQIASSLSILALPFLPFTAKKLFSMLKLNEQDWAKAGKADLLSSGHQLGEVQLMFERRTDEQVQFQLEKLAQAKIANQKDNAKAEPVKSSVRFEDFSALDIRSAKIVSAEKVAKTKKLLKLTLDTGIDQRTVVSGIAEYYK